MHLVAVSKFHPVEELAEAYEGGQRLFGENRAQELIAKAPQLPEDICWHFIGHLQTNKLKLVLPYATLVQSVDSIHLLEAIDRWGRENGKVIPVLLELHLGAEETKGGFDEDGILAVLDGYVSSSLKGTPVYGNVKFCGLMGMATNTDDEAVIRRDFADISSFMEELRELQAHKGEQEKDKL